MQQPMRRSVRTGRLVASPLLQGGQMKRREFIALVAAAVARPRAALTQQPMKVYRIAVVHPSWPVSRMTETGGLPYWRALFQELRLLGYVEGQNLAVERY